MTRPTVTKVASDVYFVESRAANWTILTEGHSLTLIDAGYPKDLPAVLQSIQHIGHRPEQIVAILITHAHIDHIGSVPALLKHAKGAHVWASEEETRHAHRDYLEQVAPRDVIKHLAQPGFLKWAYHSARAGGTNDVRIPQARPYPSHGALDVPGRPVPVLTPGHTSGHSCYHLPHAGAIVTGDALVTAHPTSADSGPQLLMPLFNHDQTQTIATLDTLHDIDAHILLPGHGPVHYCGLPEATSAARHHA